MAVVTREKAKSKLQVRNKISNLSSLPSYSNLRFILRGASRLVDADTIHFLSFLPPSRSSSRFHFTTIAPVRSLVTFLADLVDISQTVDSLALF